MDTNLCKNIILLKSKYKFPFTLCVKGCSMFPLISEDDKITVKGSDGYFVGDVIVFFYKENDLLVHRILKIKNDLFLCKGDNAFCLEMITIDHIVGKVILINGNNVPEVSIGQIEMSFEVNREFTKNNYNVDITTKSKIYIEYITKYIQGCQAIIK